jgi:hypothetical protein
MSFSSSLIIISIINSSANKNLIYHIIKFIKSNDFEETQAPSTNKNHTKHSSSSRIDITKQTDVNNKIENKHKKIIDQEPF